MKKLMTICVALALLEGVAGCGGGTKAVTTTKATSACEGTSYVNTNGVVACGPPSNIDTTTEPTTTETTPTATTPETPHEKTEKQEGEISKTYERVKSEEAKELGEAKEREEKTNEKLRASEETQEHKRQEELSR